MGPLLTAMGISCGFYVCELVIGFVMFRSDNFVRRPFGPSLMVFTGDDRSDTVVGVWARID